MSTNLLSEGLPSARPGAMIETEGQRAIQEVQAAMIVAKRFPRDPKAALDRILNSCTRISLAEQAVYCYARGGTDITGPTIRLAEAVAQQWGNLQFGIRELEQSNGESTVEAFAWDLETNTRQVKVFQVPHVRYSKSKGNTQLNDPRDIYELVANNGARRLRACILGVIPGDIIDEALRQCDATLAADADNSPDTQKKILETLAKFGVTKEQIEKRIQRRLDAITPAQVVQLKKIYCSLRDGMSTAAEWFEKAGPPIPENPIDPFQAETQRPASDDASPGEDQKTDGKFVSEADERASLIFDIKLTAEENDSTMAKFGEACRSVGLISGSKPVRDAPMDALRIIHDNRLAIVTGRYGKEDA